jgi:hypothetical protein
MSETHSPIEATTDLLPVQEGITVSNDTTAETEALPQPTDSFAAVYKSVNAFVNETWLSPDGAAYATVEVTNGIPLHLPLDSFKLKALLTQRVFAETGMVSPALIDKALMLLHADAYLSSVIYEPHVRIASEDGIVYLDLANEVRQIVEITADGWSVKTAGEVPVRFIVSPLMRELPLPAKGYERSLDKLRNIFSLDDESYGLLLGFLLGCFNPAKVYPILGVQGEQGSGKTTLCKCIRALVDPATAPVQSAPSSEQDLMIAASRSFLLCMDNLSGLSPSLSDAFCRLSTGGGFRTRKLYTGRDEEVFSVTRPVVLNGIDDLGTRNDLLDRMIVLHLSPIDTGQRKTTAEIEGEFATALPEILGGLCSAVSTALKDRANTALEEKPRMADFAEWVVSAESALPIPAGSFLDAYKANIVAAAEANVETDPVSLAICDFMREQKSWTGSMTELRSKLAATAGHTEIGRMNPNKLTADLRRATPALNRVGIEVVQTGRKDPVTRRAIWSVKAAAPTE